MIAAPNQNQLLTPAKAAWVLDVAQSTLDQYRQKRLISYVPLPAGRSNSARHLVRYRPEDVYAFIVSHTVRSRGQAAFQVLDEADWQRIQRLIDATIESKLELNDHLQASHHSGRVGHLQPEDSRPSSSGVRADLFGANIPQKLRALAKMVEGRR